MEQVGGGGDGSRDGGGCRASRFYLVSPSEADFTSYRPQRPLQELSVTLSITVPSRTPCLSELLFLRHSVWYPPRTSKTEELKIRNYLILTNTFK